MRSKFPAADQWAHRNRSKVCKYSLNKQTSMLRSIWQNFWLNLISFLGLKKTPFRFRKQKHMNLIFKLLPLRGFPFPGVELKGQNHWSRVQFLLWVCLWGGGVCVCVCAVSSCIGAKAKPAMFMHHYNAFRNHPP